MQSTVADAPADSPVKVEVQGSTVRVSSQAGITFAAKAFGEGATISVSGEDTSLRLTRECSNQVYTVNGNFATYLFTHNKAESIVVGYVKPGLIPFLPGKVFLVRATVPPVPHKVSLTPAQVKYLADMRAAAEKASANAEHELLKELGSYTFKLGLMLNGGSRAWKLATTRAADLLAQLKSALANVEYVQNFGVDPDYRKIHPGEPEMDFATIEKFGYIPNMWELRALNSPLVHGTSDRQWKILESAERGLYQLPITSRPLPVGPNLTEALERPQYLGGNLRTIDVGLPRYGPYAAVMKNEVVRQRATILAGDSGGWENGCNSSLAPVKKWWWYSRYDCKAMSGRSIPGTQDHQLHTILANTKYFAKVGGSYSRLSSTLSGKTYLARLVYQLLTPLATATPFETLLYTEAGLLGALRPQDMKMIVASFSAVYGTPQALILQKFCAKYRIPLAWGLNGGETWTLPSQDPAQLGPDTKSFVDVAADRILDPTSANLTNATLLQNSLMKTVWDAIHLKVANQRAGGEASKLQASDFIGWWKQLKGFGFPIQALHPGDCASADLCLGTYRSSKGAKDCLCIKHDEADEQKVAAFNDAEALTPESESVQPDNAQVVMV